MATVSVGSNKKYSEGWDAIFKGGKSAKKKEAPAKSTSQGKKPTPAKASAKKKSSSQKSSHKAARKSARKS